MTQLARLSRAEPDSPPCLKEDKTREREAKKEASPSKEKRGGRRREKEKSILSTTTLPISLTVVCLCWWCSSVALAAAAALLSGASFLPPFLCSIRICIRCVNEKKLPTNLEFPLFLLSILSGLLDNSWRFSIKVTSLFGQFSMSINWPPTFEFSLRRKTFFSETSCMHVRSAIAKKTSSPPF